MKRYFSALLLGSLLLLAACGSPDAASDLPLDPAAAADPQEIAWEACDLNLFSASLREPLSSLGDRLECATLKTPLDWNNPSLDEIDLGVLRVRAGNEAERKGAIFLNPGGPGGDGLQIAAFFGLAFASEGLPDFGFEFAASELLGQLSEQYDILGFSPRGVGGSFQLFCGSNKVPPVPNFYTDRSEENIQALLTSARLRAEACVGNPSSQYISTEQTVQDMDLIRSSLGDEKLNFLGFSYGSWLGAWYTKRFPERAGNIVLDASLNFSAPYQESENLDPMSFERAFREVAVPYAARNDALFELGPDDEEVYGVYEGLPIVLKQALTLGELSILGNLYSADAMPDIAVSLVAAKGIEATLETLEGELDPEAFLEAVASYTYASDEGINEAAGEAALVLAEDYLSFQALITGEQDPGSVLLEPRSAVNLAIKGNDSPWTQDPDYWVRRGNEANETYPLLGGNETNKSTAFWGEPNTAMPGVPEGIPPILMVQTEVDPATAAEGAFLGFESLPNAKLVFVENEVSHTAFPYNTECVDSRVAAYLLDGTLPEDKVSTCAAKPLPGEEEVFPVDGPTPDARASRAAQTTAESAGENVLYTLIHEQIRENAANFMGHGSLEEVDNE